MEIEVLEQTRDHIKFILKDSYVGVANALRRVIISEVPSMAIDDVFIVDNDSVLDDEFLAHRLALIPLKTDLASYLLPEKCSCKSEVGCNKCRVILYLDVEAKDSVRVVYSGDLKSEDPEIKPVSPKIPIVKLAPGQKIKLEVHAKLGRGKNHAKWKPVSICAYRYLPRIEIEQEKCNLCGECVKTCHKKVLAWRDNRVVVERELECSLCKHCAEVCTPNAIKVIENDTSFIFEIESTGVLPIRDIILEGIKILEEKVSEFSEKLSVSLGTE